MLRTCYDTGKQSRLKQGSDSKLLVSYQKNTGGNLKGIKTGIIRATKIVIAMY